MFRSGLLVGMGLGYWVRGLVDRSAGMTAGAPSDAGATSHGHGRQSASAPTPAREHAHAGQRAVDARRAAADAVLARVEGSLARTAHIAAAVLGLMVVAGVSQAVFAHQVPAASARISDVGQYVFTGLLLAFLGVITGGLGLSLQRVNRAQLDDAARGSGERRFSAADVFTLLVFAAVTLRPLAGDAPVLGPLLVCAGAVLVSALTSWVLWSLHGFAELQLATMPGDRAGALYEVFRDLTLPTSLLAVFVAQEVLATDLLDVRDQAWAGVARVLILLGSLVVMGSPTWWRHRKARGRRARQPSR